MKYKSTWKNTTSPGNTTTFKLARLVNWPSAYQFRVTEIVI